MIKSTPNQKYMIELGRTGKVKSIFQSAHTISKLKDI